MILVYNVIVRFGNALNTTLFDLFAFILLVAGGPCLRFENIGCEPRLKDLNIVADIFVIVPHLRR